MVFIGADSLWRPHLLPPPPRRALPLRRLIANLTDLWPLVVLIGRPVGTMYLGLTTATEAAGLASSRRC